MARIANDYDFEFVKSAWSVCFEDTQKFVEWNFRHNYLPQNTVIAEKDGISASAMQLMPYKLSIGGKIFNARYVSGVCTLPEYRGYGLVREMFEYAHPKMYGMGADISILIPAVDGMYEKFGYRELAKRELYKLDDISGYDVICSVSDKLIMTLDEIYKKEMSKKSMYISRCRFDWERVLTDLLTLSGGKVLINDGGYALAYPKNNGYEVWEICGDIELDVSIISAPPVLAKIINTKKISEEIFKLSDDRYINMLL